MGLKAGLLLELVGSSYQRAVIRNMDSLYALPRVSGLRPLDYRSPQLRWLCRLASNKTDTGYVDGWGGLNSNQSHGSSRDWLFNHPDLVHKKHEEHLEERSKVVESYSARALTFLSDKLPALSGAADKFGSVLSDTYIAGMWKNVLRFNLAGIGRKVSGLPRLLDREHIRHPHCLGRQLMNRLQSIHRRTHMQLIAIFSYRFFAATFSWRMKRPPMDP
jgi:hypothetical protein